MGAGGGRRSDRIRTSRAKPGQGGKSKGSGGKVQVSTKSQTGRAKVVNDREDDEQEDDEGNGTWTDTRDYFICSDFPVTNTKFMSENLVEGAVEYDCMGAPYCGLVCIDTALRKERDCDDYEARLRNFDGEAPDLLGTLDYLRDYARERGVSLAVYNTRRQLIARYDNGLSFKWVHIVFKSVEDLANAEGLTLEEIGGYGHYVLITAPQTSHNHVPDFTNFNFFSSEEIHGRAHTVVCASAAVVTALPAFCVFHSLLLATALVGGIGLVWSGTSITRVTRVDFTPTLFKDSDLDERHVVDQRDKLKHQEAYALARTSRVYNLSFGPAEKRYDAPVGYYYEPDRIVEMERFKVIAADMTRHVHLKTPHADLNSYSSVREVNSRGDSPLDASSTISVLSDFADSLLAQRKPMQPSLRGLTQCNVLGDQNAIPNIDVAAANQLAGAGHFKKNDKFGKRRNHVFLGEWKDGPDVLKEVAVAPLGPLVSADGVVSAGAISVTDSRTTLSAFIGRAMTKDLTQVDLRAMNGCVKHAKEFFTELIGESDIKPAMRGGSEMERNVAAFIESYTGKRSAKWISERVESYHVFISGTMTPRARRKFEENSFFVKFESNMKVRFVYETSVKRIQPRARGIMMMSLRMMFECAQAIGLLHQLYKTKMSQYQVKNMTSSQMCKVIEKMTDTGAMVTDASAFESSLGERLRMIEKHVMKLLCDRAGLPDLYSAFCRHTDGYRRLKTRWGTLMCCSRDSGDYWTSAFNGVVMLSLALWCSYLLKVPLDALVEGDDGLVKEGAMCPRIMGALGIQFSSSLVGKKSGDVDFLRSLWRDGKRYLVIGRSLGLLWVKKAAHLSRGKQLYLLRMSALSLYHLSPGHPVLTALINRVNRETRHVKRFKNYSRYVDTWKGDPINESKFPDDIKVDESMRSLIAEGSEGFPAVPVSLQLELERMFECDAVFYVARALDAFDDVAHRAAVVNGSMDNSNTDFLTVLEESGINLKRCDARIDPRKSGQLKGLPLDRKSVV